MAKTTDNADMLRKKLDAARMIHRQIARLNTERDTDKAIRQVLAAVGESIGAGRVYVYEQRDGLPVNTYEWCGDGIPSGIDRFRRITGEEILKLCSGGESGGITAAPIRVGEKTVGFIGADNVPEEMGELVEDILLTLGSFIGITINNSREQERLLKSYEIIRNLNDVRSILVESVGGGIFAYTLPDREILLLNSEAKRLFDCPEDASDYDFMAMITNKIQSRDYAGMRTATGTLRHPGDCAEYIFHIQKDSGELLTVKCNSKLRSFANGQKYILSAMTDVTDQEQLEDEKSRAIIESLSSIYQCVYYCNLAEDRCDVVRTQDDEDDRLIFDGTVGDFVRAYVSKYVVPEFEQEMRVFLDDASFGERFADTDMLAIEYRRRKVGWCRGTLLVNERDADNGVVGLVFAVSTIEEQKKKELQAIYDIKQQWLITKSLSEIYFASWIADLRENRITELTVPEFAKGIAEAGGGELGAAFDFLIRNFVVEDHGAAMEDFLNTDTIRERIAGREIISCEYQGRVNGWCRANFIPVEGGSDRLILAIQVIDEYKKKENEMEMALRQAFESARSANNAKTTFFANMSHDMRTPLNVIVGMTAVASSHIDDPGRVKDCLDKIGISGKHLLRLINEVLDMSKIEAGQIELREERFNLREMIDELLILIKSQLEGKQHEFLVSFHDIEHADILGDSQRIQQVFLNILGNSVKYTPEGGTITLTVSETPVIPDKVSQYEFVFEDNGIGMSEEFLAHLFDPFERADDARVDRTQGTGLGMPIAKNIVQMMNGTNSVESKLDHGSRFTVMLRLKTQEDEQKHVDEPDEKTAAAEKAAAAWAEEMATVGRGKRLLVAEDFDMNWEVLETLLPDYGFAVERAENGQVCIDKFTAAEIGYYDAVLMDLRMPVKDGYEATVEIRRADRADAGLPIIAMTADAFVEDVQACKDAGMNEHISKPLDIRKLLEILKQYLYS